MTNKITVYCEIKDNKPLDVSYELISKAYELKNKAKTLKETDNDYTITAVIIGNSFDKIFLKHLYLSGADVVVLLKTPPDYNDFCENSYADIFLDYFKNNPSDVILFPATKTARMLAPKITTSLDTGLVADCTDLDFILHKDEIKLAPTRPTFGAELMATILSKKKPQCATIRAKVFNAEFKKDIDGTYIEQDATINYECGVKLLKSYFEKKEDNIDFDGDFSKARVILAAGAGLITKDNSYFDKLKKLAKLTNSNFAVSRKVVDQKIVPSVYQIGQTGSTATPDIYIAFGISGAIQHIQGMKNSKTIIAVNTDKDAEIFKYSDYKIVADAKKIIDELLEMAKQ